jgi:YHS domain-containing protein
MVKLTSFLLLAGALAAVAQSSKAPVDPISKSNNGIALRGHDPVGYFTQGKPVKGEASYAHEWMGATWHFATAANRDTFAKDPERYAPQFGGYCAWAVSQGYTAAADPAAWSIVNDKLYVNYNKDVQKKWEKEQAELIRAAERNWPRLHK